MKKNLEYNYNIKQEETFKEEIKELYRYISSNLNEKKIAIRLVNTIISKLKILEVFPFAYKLYKKEENFEYRKFIVKNYVIIYKIKKKLKSYIFIIKE